MTTENQNLTLRQTIMKEAVKETVIDLLENSLDERGLPVYGIIEIENEHGELVRAYKQEKLFNAEDYQRAALYQAKLANNHCLLADYYNAELEKRQSAISEAF